MKQVQEKDQTSDNMSSGKIKFQVRGMSGHGDVGVWGRCDGFSGTK